MFVCFLLFFLVQSALIRERAESKEAYEDDDSESDPIEEELGFFSPLDTVNPYTSFKQALTSCVVFFPFFLILHKLIDDDLGVFSFV